MVLLRHVHALVPHDLNHSQHVLRGRIRIPSDIQKCAIDRSSTRNSELMLHAVTDWNQRDIDPEGQQPAVNILVLAALRNLRHHLLSAHNDIVSPDQIVRLL